MIALGAIGLQRAGLLQEIGGLARPVQTIVGAEDCQSIPHVGDQPVAAFPLKDLGTLAAHTGDGVAFTGPLVQIGTVGVVERAVLRAFRSEERRVGKEWRFRWSPSDY